MSDLKRVEVAAMWFYCEEYGKQNFGAVEFYKQLADYKKRTIQRMVDEIIKAQP